MTNSYIFTIDIAHPPLSASNAEEELDRTLRKVESSKDLHAIKIIHGYGSTGRGGALKELVLNWAYRNRKNIRSLIPGEEYGIFDPATQDLREQYGALVDEDLDRKNPGMTIVRIH